MGWHATADDQHPKIVVTVVELRQIWPQRRRPPS
jgi:hypothetical protein